MKKSMKKFMIACAAVSSIAIAAGMSAMAADISANYSADNNSIPVATPDGAADGTQMTVLVVPSDKKAAVTDADILYINQAAKGELPATALLKGESLADGTYSVLVGYYNAENTFSIAEDTFTIGSAGGEGTDVLVGDVNVDTRITSGDAGEILTFIADEDGIDEGTVAWYAAAFSNALNDTRITSGDAGEILTYIADEFSESVGETVKVTLN